MPVTSNFCKILAQLTAKLPQINTGAQGAATRGARSATDSPGCDSSFFQNTPSTFLLQIRANSYRDLVDSHLSRDSAATRTTCHKSRRPQAASAAPLRLPKGRAQLGHPLSLPTGREQQPLGASPVSDLGEVQLAPGAAGADDEVLGEEEALPLALLPERQRAQAAPRDLPLLRHRHLDQGACGGHGGSSVPSGATVMVTQQRGGTRHGPSPPCTPPQGAPPGPRSRCLPGWGIGNTQTAPPAVMGTSAVTKLPRSARTAQT